MKIAPQTGAEEAALRGFQSDRHESFGEISFAHRNHGFTARVRTARSQSVAGRTVWTLELEADARQQNGMEDITVGKITADQIATARARLLLLGELPKGHLREAESFITGGSVFGGRKARSKGGIFPDLWQKSAGDVVKFLRWARLSAVFALKTTNICQHVLSLELSLRADGILAVGFNGLRQSRYSNEVINIGVSGHCALNPMPSRGDAVDS